MYIIAPLWNTILGGFMYYTFDDEATTAELCDTGENRLTYGYIPSCELQSSAKHFSLPAQSLVLLASPSHINELYSYDDCIFTVVNNFRDSLAIYVKRNLLLVVALNDSTHIARDSFISLTPPEEPSLARLICILADDLILGDSRYLSTVRETVKDMEKQLISSNETKDFNIRLFRQKESLSALYDYCDNLLDFICTVQENKQDLFDETESKSFSTVFDRVTRFKESVQMVQESIEHLRDAYQSSLDLRLNQTMKVFTVVTVIFSPLSFITGWYGMNFKFMPELASPYGYLGVCVLVFFVAVGLLLWFKHKKWI